MNDFQIQMLEPRGKAKNPVITVTNVANIEAHVLLAPRAIFKPFFCKLLKKIAANGSKTINFHFRVKCNAFNKFISRFLTGLKT